jgi:concanavalin A-like lectin/glucanase superfamily protein
MIVPRLVALRVASLLVAAIVVVGSEASAQPASYLRAPARAEYDLTPSGFTVEIWARVRSLPAPDPRIVQVYSGTSSGCGSCWQLTVCSTDCPRGTAYFAITPLDGTEHFPLQGTTLIDDGQFHHLAGTYDGTEMRLYVDGALDASQPLLGASALVSGGSVLVGQSSSIFDQFDGQVDELRIWDSARSETEIQADMLHEIPVQPGLVAYWRFDGGAVDLVSGNTLTPQGNVTICPCGGMLGGAVDIWNPAPCSADPCACAAGNVNAAAGPSTDVLFVNGSSGEASRTVTVAIGSPVTASLDASPSGPPSTRYCLWIWATPPTREVTLDLGSSDLGCVVNPTPFQPFLSPQPFRVVAAGLPPVFSAGVTPLHSPPAAPWTLTQARGFARPRTLTLQGVIEDAGSASADGFSVTNAVVLSVR